MFYSDREYGENAFPCFVYKPVSLFLHGRLTFYPSFPMMIIKLTMLGHMSLVFVYAKFMFSHSTLQKVRTMSGNRFQCKRQLDCVVILVIHIQG